MDKEEENATTVTHVTSTSSTSTCINELLDWKRFNQLIAAKRTIAYVLRFINKVTTKVRRELRERIQKSIPETCSTPSEHYITATEYESALRVLLRNHLAANYSSHHAKLFKNLKTYQDEHGIIRCKGRMGRADIPLEAKCPMLLMPQTPLAEMIIKDAHLPYHCGTNQTMANVRQRFWIPRLRQLSRKTIRHCLACQKMNNLPYKYPTMNDLPERRVRKSRPFQHVGIDYFGPLSAERNENTIKVYGLIMTCATTRLLHLELVQDMTTIELLLALRRFFARRGVPETITSDNGPNFLLGEQLLRDAILPVINDTSLANAMATKGITWKTITPYAPWQGAFYERLIKSVKHSLYKILQKSVPTVEELQTLLVEVEGSLNTRPLTYQEEQPDDFIILRPIDFIQKDMIITYPFESIAQQEEDEEYLPSEEMTLLNTSRQVKEALISSHKLTERYWTIWRQQYLKNLRETHKFTIDKKKGTSINPIIDAVVLIYEPVLPRNTWKLGRIVKLQHSEDGTIREAHVKLPNGRIIRRPINLLIPLEVGKDDRQEDSRTISTETKHEVQPNDVRMMPYNLRPRIKKLQQH